LSALPFAPCPIAPPSTFNVMAVSSVMNRASLKSATAKAIETVQADKTYLMNKIQAVINYSTAVVVGCKAYANNEYASLKTKGVKAFAVEKYTSLKKTASKPGVKVTATSAAGGAVTLGAGGGFMGLTAGAGVGAAVGVLPALFTFGLSIPIGAFIGGGTGLCVGTAVGGGAGFVGGGAAGHYGYEHRAQIKAAANGVVAKAETSANAVKQRVVASKEYVVGKFVSSTGGTKEKAM